MMEFRIPPGMIDTFWASVEGPGKVKIENVASLNTTATFSTAGTYVLRLFASDGELTNFDDMTVTVYARNFLPLITSAPLSTNLPQGGNAAPRAY